MSDRGARFLLKRRQSVQQVANASSSVNNKHSKNFTARKPALHSTLVYIIVNYILHIPNVEAHFKPRQRQIISDEGLEIDDSGNITSGDEDEYMEGDDDGVVEPLWDKRRMGEGGGGGTGGAGSNSTSDLPFGRRKIPFFDIATAQHRHWARSILKEMMIVLKKNKRSSGKDGNAQIEIVSSTTKKKVQSVMHDNLMSHDHNDLVPLCSAILTEALSMNRSCSLEGLDKCYSGLVDAGRGILSGGGENGNNSLHNIIHSITILFLTTLPKQTGETLHEMGKLYDLCISARYRRRFVERIGPALLRPVNSALWSIQHRSDMEAILSVSEVIFDHIVDAVLGEKNWYNRGQTLRADEERQHTISMAEAYLQSLHDPDPSLLTDGVAQNSRNHGPHEMHEKLDNLIRGTISGMTSGEVGYTILGGFHAKQKKAPMSPRVKIPLQGLHEPSTPVTNLEHSPPTAMTTPVTSMQGYPPAPLTPKPSNPSPHHAPPSPGTPPKSPYRKPSVHSQNQQVKTKLLGPEERYRTVIACRVLREQINAFEERYREVYNRLPRKPNEKAKLHSTYAQYREWKKVIRSNAARRIQALFRGYVCRRKLIKEDSRGELTKLIKRNCSVLKKLSTVPSPGADGVEVMVGFGGRTRSNMSKSYNHQPQFTNVTDSLPVTSNKVSSSTRTGQSSRASSSIVTSTPLVLNPHHARPRHRRQVSDSSEGSNHSSGESSASSRRSDILHELMNQKRDLKAQLKQYDFSFKRQHGRMPYKSEKEPIRHLYEKYNDLKHRISSIESEMNSAYSSEGSGVSPTTTARSVSPRAISPMMGNGDRNWNVRDMMTLREEKQALHQMLRHYERTFLEDHGRQVSSFEDIRPVAKQYRRYKEIKKTITDLQESGNGRGSV